MQIVIREDILRNILYDELKNLFYVYGHMGSWYASEYARRYESNLFSKIFSSTEDRTVTLKENNGI